MHGRDLYGHRARIVETAAPATSLVTLKTRSSSISPPLKESKLHVSVHVTSFAVETCVKAVDLFRRAKDTGISRVYRRSDRSKVQSIPHEIEKLVAAAFSLNSLRDEIRGNMKERLEMRFVRWKCGKS